MSDYFMPAKNGTHEMTVDKSRFICHVYRVRTVEEATMYINEIRDLHTRATHHCVAYLIGEDNAFGRADDDGEPSGTAGAPMLEVLQRQNMRNCLVIVTRYFGGIKLGAGGLIRAYGTAVSEGLKSTGLVRRIKVRSVWLECDYALFDRLKNKIKSQGHAVGQVTYSDRVKLEALVAVTDISPFCKWAGEFVNGTITIDVGETFFKDFPYDHE